MIIFQILLIIVTIVILILTIYNCVKLWEEIKMTVRVVKHRSVLNTISNFLCVLILCAVIVAAIVGPFIKEDKVKIYNFVELQMRFKHYMLIDKFQEDDQYIFYLVNPVTKQEYKVNVTEALYCNIYFVGDTIK